MPFNNAAERALRGIAIGRRNWTFCGLDAGCNRATAIYTLIETAKLNDVDPRAWLAAKAATLVQAACLLNRPAMTSRPALRCSSDAYLEAVLLGINRGILSTDFITKYEPTLSSHRKRRRADPSLTLRASEDRGENALNFAG